MMREIKVKLKDEEEEEDGVRDEDSVEGAGGGREGAIHESV